jgi:hypothetical protein
MGEMMYFFSGSTGGFYIASIHLQMPEDVVPVPKADYERLMKEQDEGKRIIPGQGGYPVAEQRPEPTDAEIIAVQTSFIQQYVDDAAKAWGYDSAMSAVTYVGDPEPRFNAEGLAIRAFRSACWVSADAIKAAVIRGEMMTPSREELIAMLPPKPERPQPPYA